MDGRDQGRTGSAAAAAVMAVPLVVALVAGGLILLAPPAEAPAPPPAMLTQREAPEFALPPLAPGADGIRRTDLRGAVSVVNFWATWCAPCRTEMPLLRDLAQNGKVQVLGVDVKDDPAAALRFLAEAGDPFRRVGSDPDGAVAAGWGVYGLPATFVLDTDGVIVYSRTGPVDRRILDREILPAIDRLSGDTAAQ